MPAHVRISDETRGSGSHGLKCCPHTITGFVIQGSETTFADGLAMARVGDMTIHDCPHCTTGILVEGSETTFADGIACVRVGDLVNENCGTGVTISGSDTTFAD